MIQRIHLRCGSFGSVIRFWILVKKRNILFRIENPDLDLIKEINASSMLMFMREWRRRWWWWLWWWCRGCHEQWGSIKTVLSHAYSTKKQRRVLHKQQNLIQDSLAQNLTKKTAVHQQNKLGSKDINYLSFFLKKQRTDFLEIVKKVKENKFGLEKIVARLLYYSTLPLLCHTLLVLVLRKTPLQIVLIGSLYYFIPLYYLYTNYTLCFHIIPLLLI